MNDVYDAIIVGSGAGGAAVAYKLVRGGKRFLLLEKGAILPRDRSTLDVKQVFKEGRLRLRAMPLPAISCAQLARNAEREPSLSRQAHD